MHGEETSNHDIDERELNRQIERLVEDSDRRRKPSPPPDEEPPEQEPASDA